MKYQSRLTRTRAKNSRKQAFLYLFLSVVFVLGIVKVGVPGFIQLVSWWTGKDADKQSVDLNIPPQAPVLDEYHEATFSSSIRLSGLAQSEMKIRLSVNGKAVDETTTDEGGSFSFEKVNLTLGENILELVSINEKNLESIVTSEIITVDKTASEIEITEPENESQVVGANNQGITIKGKVDDGETQVRINHNYVMVNGDGEFEYRLLLNEGLNELVVSATDKAGNTSEKLLRLNFSL